MTEDRVGRPVQELAGWDPDSTLREFVIRHADILSELPRVEVTSVDSNPNVASMPWARKRIGADPGWAIATDPLVISGRSLVEAARSDEVFFGFDEVWIPGPNSDAAPPAGAYIVAPQRLDEGVPDALGRWLRAEKVRLGLGDGDGLNFVGTDMALMNRLGLT